MSHAKGPWILREQDEEGLETGADGEPREYHFTLRWIEDASGKVVVSDEYGIALPNLVLMAASPDLLEAVNEFRDLFTSKVDPIQIGGSHAALERAHGVFRKMEMAWRKAEGKSP